MLRLRVRIRARILLFLSSDVGQRGLTRAVHVDMPRPLDLTLPIANDVAYPYTLSSGNVDVVKPAYGPTLLIAVEGARPYTPLSVNVPRPSSVDVRRPMPYMGVHQPRSMINVDVDEPSFGSTRPMRVGDEGRQSVGRSTSVDVVRQPRSSSMSADVARPMPTPRQSSVIDVVQPQSMGAGVVGLVPAHVAYPRA